MEPSQDPPQITITLQAGPIRFIGNSPKNDGGGIGWTSNGGVIRIDPLSPFFDLMTIVSKLEETKTVDDAALATATRQWLLNSLDEKIKRLRERYAQSDINPQPIPPK